MKYRIRYGSFVNHYDFYKGRDLIAFFSRATGYETASNKKEIIIPILKLSSVIHILNEIHDI